MNKDGYDDVIIGAHNASPSGRVHADTSYVIYGDASLGSIDLSAVTSTQGFLVIGAAGDQSGTSVACAGDMNADGFSDVIIGAVFASPSGRSHAGTTYVI